MRTRQPLSPTRVARLFAWVTLWLLRYAWALLEGGPQARWQLKSVTRAVARLVFIRAVAMTRPPQLPKRWRPARPFSAPCGFARRSVARSIRLGVAPIVRRLRRRRAGETLCALFNALISPDALAAKLVKRLERGWTRLSPIVPVRPPAAAVTSLAAASAIGADTS